MRIELLFGFITLLLLRNDECVNLSGRDDIQRIDINEGETLTLTCEAKPSLLRSYRWVYIREGTRKPRVLSSGRRLVVGEERLSITAEPRVGKVALILSLEKIRTYEAGLFMCWRQGMRPDPQVLVRVLEAGLQKAEPLTVEISGPEHVQFGGMAKINCIFKPSWPGKISWLKNGKEISNLDRVHIQTVKGSLDGSELVASLEIKPIRKAANYSCKAGVNPPAQESLFLNVRVARVESLNCDPPKDEIQYAQSLHISCVISGLDQGGISWLKDGTVLNLLEAGHTVQIFEQNLSNGHIQSSLRINDFGVSDNGHYACTAPGSNKDVLINIEGRPPRFLGLKGRDFEIGYSLDLTCSTQYDRKKPVKWLFRGMPLNMDSVQLVIGEAAFNITHYDITLLHPTALHSGEYTCETSFGSESIFVRNMVKPYFHPGPPPVEVNVDLGDVIELNCIVVGYPKPSVHWERRISDREWIDVGKFINIYGDPTDLADQFSTSFEIEVNSDDSEISEPQTLIGVKRVLYVENSSLKYAGEYTCNAFNKLDSLTSPLRLNIIEPPEIINMTAAEVTEGDDLVITCTVKNLEDEVYFTRELQLVSQSINPKYQLKIISEEIIEYEEEEKEDSSDLFDLEDTRNNNPSDVYLVTYSLTIENAKLDDKGFYSCLAGKNTSEQIYANVKQIPPEIIEVAASPAYEGSEFFISCTISNLPSDVEVSFSRNDTLFNSSHDTRIKTILAERTEDTNYVDRAKEATYVLKIKEANLDDSGLYVCHVDQEESSIYVDVISKEVFEEKVSLEAAPAYIGGDLVLKCIVTNSEGEISFFHNTTEMLEEEDPRFELSQNNDGNVTSVYTLRILNVTPLDSGFYQCFASPFIYSDLNVTIQSLDKLHVEFDQVPDSIPIQTGEQLALNCRISGFQNMIYTAEFSHDGSIFAFSTPSEATDLLHARAKLVHDGPANKTLEEEDETINEANLRLVIGSVEREDEGRWTCRVTIPDAEFVRESRADVRVIEPAFFIVVPDTEVVVPQGENVTITCAAVGYPIPTIRWFKDDQINITLANGTEQVELVINEVDEDKTGNYTCEASGGYNVITNTTIIKIPAWVSIVEKPDPLMVVEYGQQVDFKCAASGSRFPHIRWIKQPTGELMAKSQEQAMFSILSMTSEDQGIYVCEATFEEAKDEASTELIMLTTTALPITTTVATTQSTTEANLLPTLVAGRLVQIRGPKMVEEGSTLSLLCLVSPVLFHYKYVILVNDTLLTFDGDIINPDPRMKAKTGKGGMNERTVEISIVDIRHSDAGDYKCSVNTEPVAEHSIMVTVVPPGYMQYLSNVPYTLEGSSTTTTEEPIEESPRNYIDSISFTNESDDVTDEVTDDVTNVTASITDTTPDSSIDTSFTDYNYELPFEEESGELDYNMEYDNDYKKPVKIDFDQSKCIRETYHVGSNIILSCSSIYTPNMVIVWQNMKNHITLTHGDVPFTIDRRIYFKTDANYPQLSFDNIRKEDSAPYHCFNLADPTQNQCTDVEVIDSPDTTSKIDDIGDVNESWEATDSMEDEIPDFSDYYDGIDFNGNYSVYEEGVIDEPTIKVGIMTDFGDFVYEMNDTIDEVMEDRKPKFEDEAIDTIVNKLGEMLNRSTTKEFDRSDDFDYELEFFDYAPEILPQDINTTEMDMGHVDEIDDHFSFGNITEDSTTQEPHMIGFEDFDLDEFMESNFSLPAEDDFVDYDIDLSEEYDMIGEGKEKDEVDDPKENEVEDDIPEKDIKDLENVDYRFEEDENFEGLDELYKGILVNATATHMPETETEILSTSKPLFEHESTTKSDPEVELGPEYEFFPEHEMEVEMDDNLSTTESPTSDAEKEDKDEEYDEYGVYEEYKDEDEEKMVTLPPVVKYPVIIAIPGEDVSSPLNAEVILPCPTEAEPDDITWNGRDEKLLYLGSLDLGGVPGLRLSPEGRLHLQPGIAEIRDDAVYTCLIYDYTTYEDVPMVSYKINLVEGEYKPPIRPSPAGPANSTSLPPHSTFEFPGLEWQEVAVLANNKLAGNSLTEVLKEGGINARLVSSEACIRAANIKGWYDAKISIEMCSANGYKDGLLREGQALFTIIDFGVRLPSGSPYGSTIVAVQNVVRKINVHVFGPLVPNHDNSPIECGSPIYNSQSDGIDMAAICKSSVASTVLSLQEAYLSLSRKTPMK